MMKKYVNEIRTVKAIRNYCRIHIIKEDRETNILLFDGIMAYILWEKRYNLIGISIILGKNVSVMDMLLDLNKTDYRISKVKEYYESCLEDKPETRKKKRRWEKIYSDRGHKCQVCGYEKAVEIHHIDRDSTNNIDSNLLVVCPNCHTEIHSGVLC